MAYKVLCNTEPIDRYLSMTDGQIDVSGQQDHRIGPHHEKG